MSIKWINQTQTKENIQLICLLQLTAIKILCLEVRQGERWAGQRFRNKKKKWTTWTTLCIPSVSSLDKTQTTNYANHSIYKKRLVALPASLPNPR